MNILKRTALQMAQKAYARLESEGPADLSIFRGRPPFRLVVGLSLMGISFVTCWPLITVLGGVSFHLGQPLIFTLGCPAAYAFSHGLFIVGTLIAGTNLVKYPQVFFRWAAMNGLRKVLGPHAAAPPSAEETEPAIEV